jgi:hypothetical protein
VVYVVTVLCNAADEADAALTQQNAVPVTMAQPRIASLFKIYFEASVTEEEGEGLQGVFKRLRCNGHQLEKGLQMAQRGPSLK